MSIFDPLSVSAGGSYYSHKGQILQKKLTNPQWGAFHESDLQMARSIATAYGYNLTPVIQPEPTPPTPEPIPPEDTNQYYSYFETFSYFPHIYSQDDSQNLHYSSTLDFTPTEIINSMDGYDSFYNDLNLIYAQLQSGSQLIDFQLMIHVNNLVFHAQPSLLLSPSTQYVYCQFDSSRFPNGQNLTLTYTNPQASFDGFYSSLSPTQTYTQYFSIYGGSITTAYLTGEVPDSNPYAISDFYSDNQQNFYNIIGHADIYPINPIFSMVFDYAYNQGYSYPLFDPQYSHFSFSISVDCRIIYK